MGMGMDGNMDMDMHFDLDDMLDTGMFTDSPHLALDSNGNPVSFPSDANANANAAGMTNATGTANTDNAAVNAQAAEHMRHMLRFDRVPVSTYMQRNFALGRHSHQTPTKAGHGMNPFPFGHARSQSDMGMTMNQRHVAAQNVTLTPAHDRFAISPLFGPERDEERRGRVPALRL
jgi:hypothetical protein